MAKLADPPSRSSPSAVTPAVQPPINLKNWIEENREKFKPPVSNRYLYDGRDFFVMVIKGPNARNDFHLAECPACSGPPAGHAWRGGRASPPAWRKRTRHFLLRQLRGAGGRH